ncbi:enoyl-[acyl-carrier protein] reductase I [Salinibacter ruber]|jgi:enoyl-[acyl-carrier protein] reductase I|uniref:Enoyl-[acyl-carrier-protein] reductase [NADH] n=3 Tax=Salinibacter ruber TaxID=146919 RepID=Q2S556_SALRD|nr:MULTISPECIES: enoyl-ACP reductase [Salinibacter]ABC44738.1 enoyl-(acyl-carrier-protein) reductase [Salinibacter ruber DSM 13855]MBB4060942.1 enoyl-[acyl-carrier protein] reductase I [Salinibacter ruber]MBB4069597.1 enoyl-[acyl-carrier protein] reductase I [Salinibacter ruber]MBB4089851.1 enoyl-[acyl-carrier protein] reductase I [Salinibacter ruber]MCS3610351.1 enoyl-[acyl-carrier protein] reductase I [Salinibacter ruber]
MDGYDLLDGKTGVIFGALNEDSIAWSVAQACHREGADFVLSNAPVARRLGSLDALAEETDSPIIWADATDDEELAALFEEVKDEYGSIDFIVHSIGMGVNVRKDVPYEDLNYNWYEQTLDVSAVSLHRIVNHALDTEAIDDGGSILAMSYIGAERIFSKYSEMGDAKALLESIVRSFGYRLGERNIRINAISQSPTKTTAGSGIDGFDAMYEFAERVAPLGNADADSCADYAVTLLSDLTRMVTMQTLYHDGGFSTMGISDEIVEAMEDAFAEDEEDE